MSEAAAFTGFPVAALDFYDDLEVDNTKSFWEKHKAVYDEAVKGPMTALCAALAPEFGEAKVFRPYRDVRFAKDKTPYKTNVGIGFHPRGVPKGPLVAGLYVHVAPKESFIATGVWQPEPALLSKIRDAIVERPDAWAKARKVGLDDDVEGLKRAPKGFDPEHKYVEDLKRKSFTASTMLTPAQATSADLPKLMVAAEKRMRPLNDFLGAAVR